MGLLSGIPVLKNVSVKSSVISVLGSAVTALWNALFPSEEWGIFQSGKSTRAIQLSGVIEIGTIGEAQVSTYRVETGSFTSYNKVELPTFIPIRLVKDGGVDSRLELMNWLEIQVKYPTKFDIVTAEKRYAGYTLQSYRINRNANSGAGMITADCIFQEVREVSAQYVNTKISNPNNVPATPTVRAKVSVTFGDSAGGPIS